MILFSIISFFLQATAGLASSSVSHKEIFKDFKSKEPYCSIGLVRVHFQQVKLKAKTDEKFEVVAIGETRQGTGFLMESNVVVTAAHILMPKTFKLNELYSDSFQSNNYCQFPDKVEFFPFYAHHQESYERFPVRPQDERHTPQSAIDENSDMLEHEAHQRNLRDFFVVPEEWEEYLKKINANKVSFYKLRNDYAVIMLDSCISLPGVEIGTNSHRAVSALGDNLTRFDVLVIGYPSVLMLPDKKEEKVIDPVMYQLSGEALLNHVDVTLSHTCRSSLRSSGSPVLIERDSKLIVIGIHPRGPEITSDDINRQALIFTDNMIEFIKKKLKESKIAPVSTEPTHDAKKQIDQKQCCSFDCCKFSSCAIA